MTADELAPPKKSWLEVLMMFGTGCILLGVVPLSLFCLATANDIEIKPVGPDFDPMRFGTGYSIVLMILLIQAPAGALTAILGRLVAATKSGKRFFVGSAIYMLLTFLIVLAVFLRA